MATAAVIFGAIFIGIAETVQSEIERNLLSPQHQTPTFHERVHVVPLTYTKAHDSPFSSNNILTRGRSWG